MDYNILNLSEYEIKAAVALGTVLSTIIVAPSCIRNMRDFGYSQAKKIKHSLEKIKSNQLEKSVN